MDQYGPMNVEQLKDRIAYLTDQLSEMNNELGIRKQDLANQLSPYKHGNVVAITVKRSQFHEGEKYNRRVDVVEHWFVERVLPPRWKADDFRLYGRLIKKDGTLGLREREIEQLASIVAETLEDYRLQGIKP